MPGLGLWILEGRPQRSSAIFITSHQGHKTIMVYDLDVDFDHLSEVVFGFSTVKLLLSLPPPPHMVFFGRKLLCAVELLCNFE